MDNDVSLDNFITQAMASSSAEPDLTHTRASGRNDVKKLIHQVHVDVLRSRSEFPKNQLPALVRWTSSMFIARQ